MIKIITDSSCDIAREKLLEMDVEAVPLTVFFGDQAYKDGRDLSPEEFYKKLSEVQTLPTTSQVNPLEFEEVFGRHLENGDEVLGIFLSGDLSGTCQSARIAAQNFEEGKIHIIDSKNVTMGLALLVMECVKMRDEGCSAKEIKETIDELKKKVRLVAMFSTLKYLCMGGRLSKTAATVGTLLNIFPILGISNGKLEAITKIKGKKASIKYLVEKAQNENVDTSKPITFAHSNCAEDVEELMKAIDIKHESVMVCNIGCTIGTHAGPGAMGIAYIEK